MNTFSLKNRKLFYQILYLLSLKEKKIPDVLLDLVVVEVRWGQQFVELDHVVDVQLLSFDKVAGVQFFLGALT